MLLDMQRDVAKKHNVIMDGRDIGTVVLPRAQVKIFLTASAEVRAQRRFQELQAKGKKDTFDQVLKELQKRDYQDSHREIAPLKQAKDAVVVDTSALDIDGVVDAIRNIVREKCGL
jgi:cytidylate kinase